MAWFPLLTGGVLESRGRVPAPYQWRECLKNDAQAGNLARLVDRARAQRVYIDREKAAELGEVNRLVNQAVKYKRDPLRDTWRCVPLGGKGDCEDYGIRKMEELRRRKWPLGALSLCTGLVLAGEGGLVAGAWDPHAGLIVHATIINRVGVQCNVDYWLDSLIDDVVPPHDHRTLRRTRRYILFGRRSDWWQWVKPAQWQTR